MLQMVKLKLLDSTGSSLESIDLGTMVTLKIGLNQVPTGTSQGKALMDYIWIGGKSPLVEA